MLRPGGDPISGLYGAGELAGFGGGGMHGYNALEGTFLGGCLFSGRTAGRAIASRLGRPRTPPGRIHRPLGVHRNRDDRLDHVEDLPGAGLAGCHPLDR